MIYNIPLGAGQRAIADMIENALVYEYVEQGGVLPNSVRSIEDVSFDGKLIDIKTRDVGRQFSMPNLISVDRLLRQKELEIVYDFVTYAVDGLQAKVISREQRPVYTLDWEDLRIQNLGLGQLQLVNHDLGVSQLSRDQWYERLELEMVEFYDRQIIKFRNLRNKLLS